MPETNNLPPDKEPDIKQGLVIFWNSIWKFFDNLTDLSNGLDREGTILSIKNNKRMQGANAWLLMCSIVIASIGLDLNSPAVIIGAMLISPLMSPILGIGLAVGINDKATLYISLRHFGVAIAIALFTSTLYFLITPFGEATEEILARTSPNTLDALVAFFGGIAGIISGSRIDKSNAIPGVAIATALMPPLCVTGFGIATGNGTVMINSFYLFFLNATLVAFATFIIVRFLRFPMREFANNSDRRRTNFIIYGISLLIILPSFYILSQVLRKVRIEQNVRNFLTEYCGDNLSYVDSWEVVHSDSTTKIGVKIYGTGEKRFHLDEMEELIKDYRIPNPLIQLIPTSEVDLDKYEKLQAEITNVQSLAEQLNAAQEVRNEKDEQIEILQSRLDSIHGDTLPFSGLCRELKIIFPDLEKIAVANAQESNFERSDEIPLVLVRWNRRKRIAERRDQEKKIGALMMEKVQWDTVRVIEY